MYNIGFLLSFVAQVQLLFPLLNSNLDKSLFGYSLLNAGGKDILDVVKNEMTNACMLISTNNATTNIPTGYAYSFGLAFSRANDQKWIMLFKYNSTNIAVISMRSDYTWSEWVEK